MGEEARLAGERDRLETEKLRAEIDQLRLRWYQSPSTWIAIATTLLAILGVGLQYASSRRENQLADIKLERAQLDLRQVEEQRQAAQAAIQASKSVLDTLLRNRRSIERQLARLRADIRAARASRGTRATAPDSALERIGASAESLSALNSRTGRVTDSVSAIVGDLALVYGPRGSRRFPPVPAELPPAAWLSVVLSKRSIVRITYVDPYPGAVVYASDSTGDQGRQNIGLPVPGKVRVEILPLGGRVGKSEVLDCSRECELNF
jgi:hypothetical protein